jgi:hypothetical protein
MTAFFATAMRPIKSNIYAAALLVLIGLFGTPLLMSWISTSLFGLNFAYTQPIKQEGKWGIASLTGRTIIPAEYEAIAPFYMRLAGAKKDGKWGFITVANEVEVPFQYDAVQYFIGDLAAVQQQGKWGFINLQNTQIIPFEYDEIKNFNGKKAQGLKNGVWEELWLK